MPIFNMIGGSGSNSGKLNLLYKGDVVGDGTINMTINLPSGLEAIAKKTYLFFIKATNEVTTLNRIISVTTPIIFYNNRYSGLQCYTYGTAILSYYDAEHQGVGNNYPVSFNANYTGFQISANNSTYTWESNKTYHWELYELAS